MDGIGSHGLAAAGADRREVREPARRRAQRAAAELREPAVRPGGDRDRRGAVSAGSSLSLADDRRRRGHRARRARGRARVLPDLLPARATRRSSIAGDIDTGRGAAPGRATSSASSRPASEPPPSTCTPPAFAPASRAWCSRIASSCRGSISPGTRRRCSRAGDAELDLVAEVLASGKTSRLYRTLVFEQRLATEVAASQNRASWPGFFQIVATAAPGRSLDRARARHRRGDRAARLRADRRRRDGALPRPGRGAVRLSIADRRRVRRQGAIS